MKVNVNRFVVLLLSLLFLTTLPARVQSLQFPKSISTNGRVTYPAHAQTRTPPLLDNILIHRWEMPDGLTQEQYNNASLLATHLDMYITKKWQVGIVEPIHEINPSAKVLLYRNVIVIKSFNPEWKTALDNGWLLRDSEGNLIHSTTWPTHYLVDLVNQEYRDFIVTWLNNYFSLYGFDGVSTDNNIKVSVDQWTWDCTGKPVNPRTGNLYTDEEIRDDIISFTNYVKSRIGNKLWISNGIFEGQRFFKQQNDFIRFLTETSIDGFVSEGIFWWKGYYSEDRWRQSVDFVVWVQNNFLNQTGKIFLPFGLCNLEFLPIGSTQRQMATFVFSSLLLGINVFRELNFLSVQEAMLLDEVQNLFKINLGISKGNYYVIEGTHVYARDFTKVKVLVNPTDQPYLVELQADYETLEGEIVSSINMGPHTGAILKVIF